MNAGYDIKHVINAEHFSEASAVFHQTYAVFFVHWWLSK